MASREVYPNAPIVLAAVEVRHTPGEPLAGDGLRKLSKALREVLPLRHDESQVTDILVPPQVGSAPVAPLIGPASVEHRFCTRDRRTTAAFQDSSLVLRTTNYTRFEDLRDLLAVVVEARAATLGPVGMLRIGLRYIDEVRIPMENFSTDHDSPTPAPNPWASWVHPSLLGPVELGPTLGLQPSETQGVAVFTRTTDPSTAAQPGTVASNDDNRVLVVRYGPRQGYAVSSTPDLRRPLPAPGPFFLIDIDSFWEPAEASDPTPDHILAAVDDLHAPVRELFEGLITDRLRTEVLRAH